jgi:uncharacterized membrane protein YkoI
VAMMPQPMNTRTGRFCVKKLVLSSVFLAASLASQTAADVRELSQSDLRQAVAERTAIGSLVLISNVEDVAGGEVVNIRAFEIDEAIVYRVLVRLDDGQLGAVTLDGASGQPLLPTSDLGTQIATFARATSQSAVALSGDVSQGNSGNGNAGGNGNGNAGGNGNGNSGGNGNGNGNGNSGGNGNGKKD